MEQTTIIEEWKDIPGYEGQYFASTLGRIKSLFRINKDESKAIREVILKPRFKKDGYAMTALYKHGDRKDLSIHRVIALTFIPNPENKRTVNHKDGNVANNAVYNLEWATDEEQQIHAYRVLGVKNAWKGKFGKLHNRSKAVFCITLNKEFGSSKEAERELGCTDSSIRNVCNGKIPSTKGLEFKYV
jgi:hypothetical protein